MSQRPEITAALSAAIERILKHIEQKKCICF